MVCEDTLQIKNFPPELSDAEKEEFFLHFGATTVRIITSKTKHTSVCYARFKSKEAARNVMSNLHQVRVLNSYLTIKYAEHGIGETSEPPKARSQQMIGAVNTEEEQHKKHYKTFVNRMHAFNRWVGFNQPTPAHLKYAYPRPNRATINNIAHALASVPKFYTQVLHLMNRMNFPPPFANEGPPPQPPPQPSPAQPTAQPEAAQAPLQPPPKPPKAPKQQSDSESEMESDPDSPQRPKEIIPIKRPAAKATVAPAVKRQKMVIASIKPLPVAASVAAENVTHDEVFERVEAIQPRRIELKLTTDSLDKLAAAVEEVVQEESEAVAEAEAKEAEAVAEAEAKEAEAKEAEAKEAEAKEAEMAEVLPRLTAEEMTSLPVFRNYQPGAPTAKLYIKNISKTVDASRLERLYRPYNHNAADDEGDPDTFDVRLMQEGRMKGQAFVTLRSVGAAQRALLDTNAVVLDDKALVVVFGKVPPSSSGSSSKPPAAET